MVRYLLVFVLTKPGGYCHAGSVPVPEQSPKFTVPFTWCKSVARDRLKRTHSSKCKQMGNFHACSRVQCGIFKTKQTMPWNKWDPCNHKSARNGPDVQDFTLNHIKWLPLPSSASYNKSWNDYKVKEKCTFQIMPQNRTERPYTGFYFVAVRNRWQPDMTSQNKNVHELSDVN